MKTGFVLLRDFIYGLDFTETNEIGKIIVYKTSNEVEKEILSEMKEENYEDDLYVGKVIITDDGYLIVVDENNNEVTRSEKPNDYIFD